MGGNRQLIHPRSADTYNVGVDYLCTLAAQQMERIHGIRIDQTIEDF